MVKQVKAAAAVNNTDGAAATNGNSQNNLYISVKTFDRDGRTIGERIVDMYHFGTRNWLQNHHWWAMHHGNDVETKVATDAEIADYLAAGKAALADKFNTTVANAPAEAAAA